MKSAIISKRAQRDLDKIRDRIATENPDVANQVWHSLLDTADLLAAHPDAGKQLLKAPARHADVRWFVSPNFRNYLIFYRPFRQTILVMRVLHAARDWTRFFDL